MCEVNLTPQPWQPQSPEVEARVQSLVALLLIQPSEGVFRQTALHQTVQVTVPFDLDANDAPLWWPVMD